NTSTYQIRLPSHGLSTGDRVIYHEGQGFIAGLVDGQSYFVIKQTADRISLAATKAESLQANPTLIRLNADGASTGTSFTTPMPTISAKAMGGAGSAAGGSMGLTGALAGAGAGALNVVDNQINADITGCLSTGPSTLGVFAQTGSVVLTATDDSVILADTGGFAVALAGTGNFGAGSLSVAASKSTNDIGQSGKPGVVSAYI